MIMRLKVEDFSEFAGFKYEHSDNEILDKYLKLFKENSDYKYLQIEDKFSSISLHLICYIKEYLKPYKMFTRFEYDSNGEIESYWLCFTKNQ